MAESLTEAENVGLGVTVALVEGIILQPTLYWKNAMQQALPLTLDPRKLYRGIGASLANEAGQMSIQFGVTGMLKSQLSAAGEAELSGTAEVAAAAAGGMTAAVFASPVELVMIQQQRFGGGLLGTPLQVAREYGVTAGGLFRGLGPAVIRVSSRLPCSGLLCPVMSTLSTTDVSTTLTHRPP